MTASLTPEQLLALKKQNHNTEIYTCSIVFSILTIVAVVLRVTSKHMKKVAVGIDDVLVAAALVSIGSLDVHVCGGTDCSLIEGHHACANNLHLCW